MLRSGCIRTTANLGLIALAIVRTSSAVSADESWPQFRGVSAAGVASDSRPPTTWSETENVRWKVTLPGAGASSPIVTQGRVFVTCFSGDKSARADVTERHLVCVDLATGKVLWTKSVAAAQPEDRYQGFIKEHGFASNSPVTDGERVIVFYGKSGVLAYDLEGNELWKADVGRDSSDNRWGSAASLILAGNSVIVNASEESRSIRALDKLTGKEEWSSSANALELSYITPALVKTAEGRDDLVVVVSGEVWGLNPETGKLRWYVLTQMAGNVSPSPIVDGDIVYVTGGRPTVSHAIRVGGKGDMTSSNLLWSSRSASYVATPLLHRGHLYWIDDSGQAFCQRASNGDVVYRERVPGLDGGRSVYSSPVLAGELIYVVTRTNGTFVLSAAPTFKVLSQNRLSDHSEFNATPAIVGNELLLRSDKALYCIGRHD